jgi:hypothetical protein
MLRISLFPRCGGKVEKVDILDILDILDTLETPEISTISSALVIFSAEHNHLSPAYNSV